LELLFANSQMRSSLQPKKIYLGNQVKLKVKLLLVLFFSFHYKFDYRQPKSSTPLLGSSTPRPYVPLGRIGLDEQKRLIAQQRATIRDHFFQTPLTAPPLISSMMSANNNIGIAKYSPLPRMEEGGSHSSPANSTVTSVNSTSSKKY
jgi:hypothetical protein